jgi:predicted nucleotidyltransferase
VSLLAAVTAVLEQQRTAYALIGAGALAVHGISRSTLDQDLLVVDPAVLDADMWAALTGTARCDIRRGDADDPLLGVVRITADGQRDVDVIVGRYMWQRELLRRAQSISIGGRSVPVARPADLILLKLYAGGSQDRWDIEQLLALDTGEDLAMEVERSLAALPARCRELWARLRVS